MKNCRGLIGLVVMFGWSTVDADIIVDGINCGREYVLSGSADSVAVDSGTLMIGDGGSVKHDLTVRGGQVVVSGGAGNLKGLVLLDGAVEVQGGRIFAPEVRGGSLLISGASSKVVGGLSMDGGVANVMLADKINGGISLNDHAVLYMADIDVNGTLSVSGGSTAYFAAGYVTDASLTPFGKVVDPPSGSIIGQKGSMLFSVEQGASLYVGVVPEPATLALAMFFGGGLLLARRMFPRPTCCAVLRNRL